MYALESLITENERERFYQAYTADMLWYLEKSFCPNFSLGRFTEYTEPKEKEEKLTGEEIKQRLLKKLGG